MAPWELAIYLGALGGIVLGYVNVLTQTRGAA